MNVLFLTMGSFESVEARSLYSDLLRCFRNHNHEIFVVAPSKKNDVTELLEENHSHILHVKTGKVTGSGNLIKKGVSQILLAPSYSNAIKKYYSNVKFDLIIYSTPPITLAPVVESVKKRYGARTYLLLKDIFPQNAVDIGMMNKNGLMGLAYRWFRRQEKKLYDTSDIIGCMSDANIEYLLNHNPELKQRNRIAIERSGKKVVELCPNCVEAVDMRASETERRKIREKYRIPLDKIVFIYGGNLGRPQGIDFMLEALQTQSNNDDVFFFVVGTGTEYNKIEKYIEEKKIENICLRRWLPKEDFDKIVASCDVGLIFLDHRFTIPNFPSRLLSYMQAGIPILACTDVNTDLGTVIQTADCGWWCESDDVVGFNDVISAVVSSELRIKGDNGYKFLLDYYTTEKAYNTIIKHMENL